MLLGLDWDGTITGFPESFRILASRFDRIVIITVNPTITVDCAATQLSIDRSRVEVTICPNESVAEYAKWKADQCELLGVDLMFDDDRFVVEACLERGVPVIGVAYG